MPAAPLADGGLHLGNYKRLPQKLFHTLGHDPLATRSVPPFYHTTAVPFRLPTQSSSVETMESMLLPPIAQNQRLRSACERYHTRLCINRVCQQWSGETLLTVSLYTGQSPFAQKSLLRASLAGICSFIRQTNQGKLPQA